MSAEAAMASDHRCSKCGETDLAKFSKSMYSPRGLQYWCKACNSAYRKDWLRWTQGKPSKHKQSYRPYTVVFVKIVCATCEKDFSISAFQQKRRLEQKTRYAELHGTVSDGKLYCSKSCASLRGQAQRVAGRKLKVRSWKSTDQNYWDQVLHEAGLGEWRGYRTNFIRYGLHEYVEGVDPDGSIRIIDRKKDKD